MSKSKHIFQLPPEEQQERLRSRIAEVQEENLNAGLYNIFQDKRSKDQLILQYRDHTEVVKVDKITGTTRVVTRNSRWASRSCSFSPAPTEQEKAPYPPRC